jgi:hypothetical protein
MATPDLARAARRIEELPTDDGSVLDTIAGAILRIFVRINQLEGENARLSRRLAALERKQDEQDDGAAPCPWPPTEAAETAQTRPGGRPLGSASHNGNGVDERAARRSP